ncbi:hypothetical protein PGH12_11220 [Chryseobacterium wangxinyae]|uniref:hypothetical protein n=1 Tax=Chryseobacterium sp. CY350 TaxID=2997336 RepID=UPI00226ED6A3|nr:hypothetical protein [Chryseobacterium sp. CY350]MCY0976360.1 hypothetical protein [Chryseobacterium sp. CY350]WBZ94043.1 hypothetical protein PGH12_11220 [Chryseobacterium sp. CY350]
MESVKFALSSFLLVFFILFPGIILKRSYFRGEFTKQFSQGDFSDRIITTFFWGCIAQIFILLIYNRTIDNSVDFEFISNLTNSFNEESDKPFKLSLDNKDSLPLLVYFSLLVTVPFTLGFLGYLLVRFLHLDHYTSAFRFANYWYYYYSGEIITRKEFENASNSNLLGKNGVEEVIIDVVVNNGDRNVLYSGFFSQYTICKTTNKLESIFLTAVRRYSNSSQVFVPINSSIFHIPAEKIYNLNLRYIEKSTSKSQRRKEKFVILFFMLCLVTNLILPWIYLNSQVFVILSGILFGVINIIFLTAFLYSILFWRNNANSSNITITSGSNNWITLILYIIIISFISFIQLRIFDII